jgi:hypothetical protein
VNHGQNWKGWERSGEKVLIISDNQAQTCLIITINDTSTGDLPLIITISDTCKNQPNRLDFDNTINLSSLIVSLGAKHSIPRFCPSLLCSIFQGKLKGRIHTIIVSNFEEPEPSISKCL